MAGTYTKLYYHIVFSTKCRKNYIMPAIETELYKYVAGIFRNLGGSCIEVNGMPDHLHILAILPAKMSLSEVLRTIKSSSSKWIHEAKPDLPMFGWQDGYSAFTVSKSQVEPVRQYIRDQKSHHARRPYVEELIDLLNRHAIEYDERYLWE